MQELSRFELAQLWYEGMNLANVQISILMTVLFAYFALVYLAAKKLGKFETFSITAIYSAFYLFVLAAYFSSAGILSSITLELFKRDVTWNLNVYSTVLLVGWVSSLYYMYREKRKDDT